MFDEIIIAVGANALKKSYYPLSVRKEMITKVFQNEPRISVSIIMKDLLSIIAGKMVQDYLLRGLRTAADFEFERAIAQVNRALTPEVESVFLLTIPEHTPINSTIVRDIIRSGGDASRFVPSAINLKDYKGEDL